MVRTLHFQDVGSYHRWLAFGHIHHKFHGKAHIMIRGKHHAVVHKTHHEAGEIREHREGRIRIIRVKMGRGMGMGVRGKGNSVKRPNLNSNIWHGANHGIIGGRGGLKFGKISLGNIKVNL